ncbi:MAG: carboxymuconolactone decarboxylase family protein [Ilumatobacteraceae bacterium]
MSQSEYQLSLPARTETDGDPAVAALLGKAKAGIGIGMIPNMYANMANAPGLLETYLSGYAAFRSESGLSAAEQETVFLTISRVNGCSYCVTAHSTIADMTKIPTEITDALRNGTTLPDPKLDALATFTLAMLETRGLPSHAQVEAFLGAGYTEQHVLFVVLALAVKTISNYSNHLFHTPVDAAFVGRSWEQ